MKVEILTDHFYLRSTCDQ